MQDTETGEGMHSSVDKEKHRLRWRFFGSLVLLGLMVGMMLGRLTAPGPIELQAVEERPWGLSLWFDREPVIRSEAVYGTYALHIAARTQAREGQLRQGDTLINWRLRPQGETATLGFIATRPLQGRWSGEPEDDRWRLDVRLDPP